MSSSKLSLICFAGLALILGGCVTKPLPGQIPPIADPCPSEGLAPVKEAPVKPIIASIDQGLVYGAIAGVLGADKAQALVRYWESEMPQWGQLGWTRVDKTKTWCEGRLPH